MREEFWESVELYAKIAISWNLLYSFGEFSRQPNRRSGHFPVLSGFLSSFSFFYLWVLLGIFHLKYM